MDEFQGSTAVVTGGGSGIGAGMCRVFARTGMNIVVADTDLEAARTVAEEIRSSGGAATAIGVDVSDRTSVVDLAAAATNAYGRVSVLCNNAGVSLRRRGIHATHEDWTWMVGVNLWGAIHGIETFLPAMLDSDEPSHIVNTSSINGIVPSGYSAMYSTTKFGLVGLTETMRNELAGTNVGMSVLCPGMVRTRLSDAERTRPATLPAPSDPPPHVPSSSPEFSPALDPDVVGEMTLQGIRDDALYIFTDMKTRDLIRAHHERMMQHFDDLAAFEARPPTNSP